MWEKENISLFKNLNRAEKLETLSSILENYKNSENVFNGLYKAFHKNKEYLDEKSLLRIYETIISVLTDFQQKKLQNSSHQIQEIKESEYNDKFLEEKELDKILEEI